MYLLAESEHSLFLSNHNVGVVTAKSETFSQGTQYFANSSSISLKMASPVADPLDTGTESTSERTSSVVGSTVLTTRGNCLLPPSSLPPVDRVNGLARKRSARQFFVFPAISLISVVALLRPHWNFGAIAESGTITFTARMNVSAAAIGRFSSTNKPDITASAFVSLPTN